MGLPCAFKLLVELVVVDRLPPSHVKKHIVHISKLLYVLGIFSGDDFVFCIETATPPAAEPTKGFVIIKD